MAENRWAMGVAEGRQRTMGDAFVRYSPQQLGAAMVGPAMAEPLLEQAFLPCSGACSCGDGVKSAAA